MNYDQKVDGSDNEAYEPNIIDIAPSHPAKTILHISTRQREELSQLSEDTLQIFQEAFNRLVSVATGGKT